MNKQGLILPSRQGGVTVWHMLGLVVVVVALVLYFNARGFSFFTERIPNFFSSSAASDNREPRVSSATYYRDSVPQRETASRQYVQEEEASSARTSPRVVYNDDLYEAPRARPPSYDYNEEYPPRLSRGFYTVQVFSGYNSRDAYELRRALGRDGYQVYIQERHGAEGIQFKVRIGTYRNRVDAFAVRDQIRKRYANRLHSSFVMLVDN